MRQLVKGESHIVSKVLNRLEVRDWINSIAGYHIFYSIPKNAISHSSNQNNYMYLILFYDSQTAFEFHNLVHVEPHQKKQLVDIILKILMTN